MARSGYFSDIKTSPERAFTLARKSLRQVDDPHLVVVVGDGTYLTGEMTRGMHVDLLKILNGARLATRKPLFLMGTEDVVSGIGFKLKTDPSTKFVRLDRDGHELSSKSMADVLTTAGYIILDPEYNEIHP